MVVAVDHPLAEHVLNVQMVGNGLDHVGPEALAVQQRQLDLFTAGDITNAENDGIEVAACLGQAHDQPQVLILTACTGQADFQFQSRLSGENRLNDRNADPRTRARFTLDQRLPCLFAVLDVQQAQSDFVEFADAQLLQQAFQGGGLAFEQTLEVLAVPDLECFQLFLQAGHVHDTDCDARALEDIPVAASALQHLALASAQAHQRDQRQDRQQHADQALADQRRKQFAAGLVGVEQPPQLPVTVAQRLKQNGVGQATVRVVGGHRFMENDPLRLALFETPQVLKVLSRLAGKFLQSVGRHAHCPVIAAHAVAQANQYINLVAVFGVGIEVGATSRLFHGPSEKLSVARGLGAVTDNLTRRVQAGDAAQRGQGSAQVHQRRRLLQLLPGGERLVQQVHGDLRLERHVQTHPVGQLHAVLQTALTLTLLSLVKLLDQLPEQQGKHHQNQARQHAFH